MVGPEAMTAAIGRYVEAGELAGAAARVWKGGRLAYSGAAGSRDLDAGLSVEEDTIFRIASMSKPVTSVLALMLMEEGRFSLEDPIARVAPEFMRMRVLTAPGAALDDTVSADRLITFGDLLTHRAGLTYGDFSAGPINDAYAAALGADIDSAVGPDAWIAGLAALPLIAQPGAGFTYSHATDLLGLLIARMDGAPLEEVMRERLFAPLGMADTGFTIPAGKRHRRAAPHGFDAAGKPAVRDAPGGAFMPERPEAMTFVSGGQGLWSTTGDYLKFARLFVEGGAVDGVRILRPQTMALMMSNQLTDDQRAGSSLLGMPLFAAGHSFGLGVAVVMEPDKASVIRCGGGVGSVGWPGAYGGWWQADPNDGSVMVFLTHNMLDLEQIMQGVGLGVYAAITDFQQLATGLTV
jgi:CubicO group peptidase (beta-lactamase class C family)